MHANINPEMRIDRLPYSITLKLSDYLEMPDDSSTRPYWKSLIAVLPGNMYSDVQINKFSMAGLQPHGSSSAECLLRDLGQRYCKTVKQLAAYLDKLHYEDALRLIKSPEPLSITGQPISCSVMSGDTVKFQCQAKGFPYPRYKWYRAKIIRSGELEDIDYTEVADGVDSILEIPSAEMSHSGGYCCKVYHFPQENSTQIDYQLSEWAYLTVLSNPSGPSPSNQHGQVLAPPVIRQEPELNVRVDQGRELELTCRATGCPKPDYQWFKYEENFKTGTFQKEPIKGCTSEVLQFAQATLGDSGQYVCHVTNQVGEAWSITVQVTVTTLVQNLRRRCKIEILREPMDVQCVPGADQKLECLASCSTAKLFFQWYKDDEPMEGEKGTQLCFHALKMSDAGRYMCRVSAENGQYVDSKVAELKFPVPEERFTATDKVALLIGNEDYRSGDLLSAPGNDMQRLARSLYSMNFKVVSLLNLTMAEMKKALALFCSLLNTGVYGLFYFSGHGFQQSGQTYMVPADAPTGYRAEECVCAEEVVAAMQTRDTALNVILLDICRKFNEYAEGKVEHVVFKPKGNTVYGYAASVNSEAYEVKKKGYAIFTKHLEKRIHEDRCIYDIIIDVIADVSKDDDAKGCQFPSLSGNLKEKRSLQDAVWYTGHTEEFNCRSIDWQKAHVLPGDILINNELQYNLVAKIEFEIHFSNVMLITAKILSKGYTSHCEVFLRNFPREIDCKSMVQHVHVRDANGMLEGMPSFQVRIENIQQLRGEFTFSLLVHCDFQGNRYSQELPICIDRPLVSQVWLSDEAAEYDYPDSTTSSNSLL